MYRMAIGVTKKFKKFEINPIFAKKSYSTKPHRGIGSFKKAFLELMVITKKSRLTFSVRQFYIL